MSFEGSPALDELKMVFANEVVDCPEAGSQVCCYPELRQGWEQSDLMASRNCSGSKTNRSRPLPTETYLAEQILPSRTRSEAGMIDVPISGTQWAEKRNSLAPC